MRSRLALSPSIRLLLGAALSLAAMLALWWFWLRPYLAGALVLPTGFALRLLMPDEVLGVASQPGIGTAIMTALAPLDRPDTLVQIPLSGTLRRFTFIFPVFWGLVLATPVAPAKRLYQFFIGTFLVILPCAVLMSVLLSVFQLSMLINHQAVLNDGPPPYYVFHLPYSAWAYYFMGVGRQLAVLVMPTIVPLIAWGIFNHGLLRASVLNRLLGHSPEGGQK